MLLCDTRAKTLPPHGVPHLTSEVREQSTDVDGASAAAQAANTSGQTRFWPGALAPARPSPGRPPRLFPGSSRGTATTELRPAQRRSWLWLRSVIPESGEAGQERNELFTVSL